MWPVVLRGRAGKAIPGGRMCWGLGEGMAGLGWNVRTVSLYYSCPVVPCASLQGLWFGSKDLGPLISHLSWPPHGSLRLLARALWQSLWWALCPPVHHCGLFSWCWSQLWEDAGSSRCLGWRWDRRNVPFYVKSNMSTNLEQQWEFLLQKKNVEESPGWAGGNGIQAASLLNVTCVMRWNTEVREASELIAPMARTSMRSDVITGDIALLWSETA